MTADGDAATCKLAECVEGVTRGLQQRGGFEAGACYGQAVGVGAELHPRVTPAKAGVQKAAGDA